MTVELTSDELDIINALNEACNDIYLKGEFGTHMGCTVEAASFQRRFTPLGQVNGFRQFSSHLLVRSRKY